MSQPLGEDDANFSVDVVIPVLNEAHVLRKSVETVLDFLRARLRYRWTLILVDNGSTDATKDVAEALMKEHSEVKLIQLTQKGRGRALRSAWLQATADIVCYMDVDLSTGLDHLPALLSAVAHEGYDLSTGSRLMRQSQTTRSLYREVVSRVYNLLVKAMFSTRFSDAQCGFKAASRRAVETIVPKVEDQSWFFDTEFLVRAEKSGYRIKDIPVVWVEDIDSRVKIVQTGWEDLKGLVRVRRQLSNRRMADAPVTGADERRS
jgi:glycosyltransferase involved in cell wall biosynthesis